MRILVVCSALLACCAAAPQYAYDGQSIASLGSLGGGLRQGGDKYLPPATTTPAPIIRKQFYTISAPDDGDNQERTKHLVLGRPQKNYRVIFIKAPAGDGGNVKYSAELAPQDEKTVIYVLSKKANELDGNDIATAPTQAPTKPDVFFIKYKTDEEADHAQKEIQGEYDKLGGTNEFLQDKAPITSVVGSLDGLNPDGSYNYRPVNGGGGSRSNEVAPLVAPEPSAPSSQYLPSFFKH